MTPSASGMHAVTEGVIASAPSGTSVSAVFMRDARAITAKHLQSNRARILQHAITAKHLQSNHARFCGMLYLWTGSKLQKDHEPQR